MDPTRTRGFGNGTPLAAQGPWGLCSIQDVVHKIKDEDLTEAVEKLREQAEADLFRFYENPGTLTRHLEVATNLLNARDASVCSSIRSLHYQDPAAPPARKSSNRPPFPPRLSNPGLHSQAPDRPFHVPTPARPAGLTRSPPVRNPLKERTNSVLEQSLSRTSATRLTGSAPPLQAVLEWANALDASYLFRNPRLYQLLQVLMRSHVSSE
ncbi:hypothetical protein LTR56_002047 [Elasticomyces elasticus]|nr:hypothetical protein LTR22_012189 [Elasticomyces elasticus]KAK3658190.1 hypothetical protein LTR56_002047 [Elasticomyces elasticus]KAK4919469.1 hypothetical protein LTR49_012847 [Elasticomyces elasticus]KAK5764075.1 hypothetical protein LTS12_005769 [Elasticomyces elasticus]